jgi:predicted nucleic acid-binding protein
MAGSILVDAGFLVALLSHRDHHHHWAAAQAQHLPLPWKTCESVLSEAFHLVGSRGTSTLATLIRRRAVVSDFEFHAEAEAVLKLMQKYGDMPMSLADACLVRMTEVLPNPILLTTDSDFRTYRRHGRHVVPVTMPY